MLEMIFYQHVNNNRSIEQVHWKYYHKFVKRFNLLTNTVSVCYVNSTVPRSHEINKDVKIGTVLLT